MTIRHGLHNFVSWRVVSLNRRTGREEEAAAGVRAFAGMSGESVPRELEPAVAVEPPAAPAVVLVAELLEVFAAALARI